MRAHGSHTKLFTPKVRKHSYVNPAVGTPFFSLSLNIRALYKFQMCWWQVN